MKVFSPQIDVKLPLILRYFLWQMEFGCGSLAEGFGNWKSLIGCSYELTTSAKRWLESTSLTCVCVCVCVGGGAICAWLRVYAADMAKLDHAQQSLFHPPPLPYCSFSLFSAVIIFFVLSLNLPSLCLSHSNFPMRPNDLVFIFRLVLEQACSHHTDK